MTTKKYTLTDEHRAQLKSWADRWIANALSTRAMDDDERRRATAAVRGLYEAAKLAPPAPGRILFVSSPQTAAIAATIAAGVRWLRAHPERHAELCGGPLDEPVLQVAIVDACRRAVRAGFGIIPTPPQRATDDATADATDAATRAAAYAATRAATAAATAAATGAATAYLLRCCEHWWRLHNGGCHWSAYAAYLSFFRHVARLPLDYAQWAHYETLAEVSASRMMHADFCIVSDRPEILRVDDAGRPHCETGPSHRWRDGWERYHWHGVNVPREWITDRASLTAEIALGQDNAERRRAACEILGWARVLDDLDATMVDEDRNPMIGTLLRADLPDAPASQFLRVLCGTGRIFVLPVPPASDGITTALAANAWTYNLDERAIRALKERT